MPKTPKTGNEKGGATPASKRKPNKPLTQQQKKKKGAAVGNTIRILAAFDVPDAGTQRISMVKANRSTTLEELCRTICGVHNSLYGHLNGPALTMPIALSKRYVCTHSVHM